MKYTLRLMIEDLAAVDLPPGEDIYAYLCQTDALKLKKIYDRLMKVRDFKVFGNTKAAKQKRGKQSYLIGRLFEKLISVLLGQCKVIEIGNNVRSTISEIDFVVKYTPYSSLIPMLAENGTHAIGEAKCVATGLKTEWVNELSGILQLHSASLGILFTACPPKKLNVNHKHAISLHAAQGRRIVPFGLTQVSEVMNGKCFLKLLCDQYVDTVTHSNALHI